MVKINKIYILATIIVLLQCQNSVEQKPVWLSGIWEGTVGYEHYEEEYEICIEFNDTSTVYKIEYLNHGCSGLLKIDSIENNYVKLKEEIIYANDICHNFGNFFSLMELENSGVLHVQYLNPEEKDNLVFGQLVRPHQSGNSLLLYKWYRLLPYYSNNKLARLVIPKGFKEHHWHYGEGIVTTLTYSDSSYIVLHNGFTMRLPLLDEPDYQLSKEMEWKDRIIRTGTTKNTNLVWREDHFNNEQKDVLHIAYGKVPVEKIDLFNKALDSFYLYEIY